MRREIGAMRQDMSFRLQENRVSTLALEKRLLAIENSFLVHVNARLDSLLSGVITTHLDIQNLALEFDQAHDRVFDSVNHVRGAVFDIVHESQKQTCQTIDGLSQALTDDNEKTRNSFLEIGRGIDGSRAALMGKLDTLHRDAVSTICSKVDNANGNVNQNIMDSRDHLCDKISQVQHEVESSRRRINEKINSMHEAIAGILNTTRDRVTHKVDRLAVILASTLSALRDIRKACPALIHDSVRDPDTDVDSEVSKKKKTRFESILKIPKH
ncbi:hypothetical protein E4U42_007230 [Claviceps africana]|uniref:Uncharacterized protein n=1 Tax=Claviceps africana TaxID=83212 RepID=A0A8K0JBH0_9HYPO|nr:hypothetical protein E4U42_007230 [Claviceps africana]